MKKMTGWIKATSDIMVRVLLGQEENIALLKDFINAVLLDRGFSPVVELSIKNPANMKDVFDSKESWLDVKATDESGRIIDVEIQSSGNREFIKRSLYYWAKLYSSQLEEGQEYRNMDPVICINLLNFIMFPDKDEVHSCHMICDLDNPDSILTDHLQIHYLELPKMNPDIFKIPTDRLNKWLWYFREEGNVEEEYMKILIKDDEVFDKAHATYKKFTSDEEIRDRYEARLKFRRDQTYLRDVAEEEGLKKGLEQGLEQGREEASKKYAAAMKKSGIDQSLIKEITGLTVEVIESL